MSEMEDKEFSWTPEYGWRTCIKMLTVRSLIVLGMSVLMLLLLATLRPDMGGSHSGFTRFHTYVVIIFALINSYVLLRSLMNETGLGEWSLFLAAFLAILMVWSVTMAGLLFFGIAEYYMEGITFCCGGMLFAAWGMLKFQDYQ